MAVLHDDGMRDAFVKRVQSLTPTTTRVWGKMSIDQMLHHVNTSLAEALGEYTAERSFKFLPEWLLRFIVIDGPWGRGAPTRPDMLVPGSARYDFEAEKKRTLDMINRFVAKPMSEPWPRSANFACTGRHWSKLEYRHLDHHLRQFGV